MTIEGNITTGKKIENSEIRSTEQLERKFKDKVDRTAGKKIQRFGR